MNKFMALKLVVITALGLQSACSVDLTEDVPDTKKPVKTANQENTADTQDCSADADKTIPSITLKLQDKSLEDGFVIDAEHHLTGTSGDGETIDDTFVTSLTFTGGVAELSLGEKSGSYAVTVQIDGYEPVELTDLKVESKSCEVKTVTQEITLTPAAS